MQQIDSNGTYKMLSYLKHYTAYSVESSRFTFVANVSMFDFWARDNSSRYDISSCLTLVCCRILICRSMRLLSPRVNPTERCAAILLRLARAAVETLDPGVLQVATPSMSIEGLRLSNGSGIGDSGQVEPARCCGHVGTACLVDAVLPC